MNPDLVFAPVLGVLGLVGYSALIAGSVTLLAASVVVLSIAAVDVGGRR